MVSRACRSSECLASALVRNKTSPQARARTFFLIFCSGDLGPGPGRPLRGPFGPRLRGTLSAPRKLTAAVEHRTRPEGVGVLGAGRRSRRGGRPSNRRDDPATGARHQGGSAVKPGPSTRPDHGRLAGMAPCPSLTRRATSDLIREPRPLLCELRLFRVGVHVRRAWVAAAAARLGCSSGKAASEREPGPAGALGVHPAAVDLSRSRTRWARQERLSPWPVRLGVPASNARLVRALALVACPLDSGCGCRPFTSRINLF